MSNIFDKVKVTKRNSAMKQTNSEDIARTDKKNHQIADSFTDMEACLLIQTSSPIIPPKRGAEMNNAQPGILYFDNNFYVHSARFFYLFVIEEEGDAVEYVSEYQKKILHILEAILDGIRDLREEGLTYESVMKDNMDHFKKIVDSQLKLPIHIPKELAVLNAALGDLELSVCLVRDLKNYGLTFNNLYFEIIVLRADAKSSNIGVER